jgi:hypothetical protein
MLKVVTIITTVFLFIILGNSTNVVISPQPDYNVRSLLPRLLILIVLMLEL